MKTSEDAQKVLDFLKEYSNNNLRKPNDLAMLLESGASYGLDKLFNDLTFAATSLWRVYKTLQKPAADDDILSKLKAEFRKSSLDLIEKLREYRESIDIPCQKRLDETYLNETEGALRNLIDLSHDFAILKQVQKLDKQ